MSLILDGIEVVLLLIIAINASSIYDEIQLHNRRIENGFTPKRRK